MKKLISLILTLALLTGVCAFETNAAGMVCRYDFWMALHLNTTGGDSTNTIAMPAGGIQYQSTQGWGFTYIKVEDLRLGVPQVFDIVGGDKRTKYGTAALELIRGDNGAAQLKVTLTDLNDKTGITLSGGNEVIKAEISGADIFGNNYDQGSFTYKSAAPKKVAGSYTFIIGVFDLARFATCTEVPDYTVTFDSQGGSAITPQIVNEGEKAVKPSDPIKDGYDFVCWSLGGAEYDFNTSVISDLTLTAQWSLIPPVTYTVTFNANGGTPSPDTQTVISGNTATKPTAPTRTGYTFAGWFAPGSTATFDFANTPITAELTLTAEWTINTYTVTFDPNGGTPTPPAQTVPYNGTAAKPTDPTRTGYTFNGWYTSATDGTAYVWSTPVTANITIYAQWTINTYTVTFDSRGGSAIAPQTVPYNDTATKPTTDPTKTGYTFVGWNLGTSAYNFSTPVVADITLVAQWTINNYTVTFDSAGGSAVAPQTVPYNSTAIAPTPPTKTGYTFAGWSLGASAYNFSTPVTASIILAAQWIVIPPATYTVTFDVNGGAPTPPPQVINTGNTATKPTDPTRTGYTFDGWYLNGNVYNFSTPVTSDITLTAQWTPVVPPTGITMSASQGSLNMKVGTKLQLNITISPANADPSVTWSSSNTAVATVDGNGLVTAIKTGSVRITVTSKVDPSVNYMFLVMISA